MIDIMSINGRVLMTVDADSLVGMNLSGADIFCANFFKENLSGANLSVANLSGANLSGAYLGGTYLSHTDFSGANLNGTCLDPEALIPTVIDKDILAAGLQIIDDRVYGWRTRLSWRFGSTDYAPREEPYIAPWFSVATTSCHPGIYLAGKSWLLKIYPNEKYVRCYCLRNELHRASDKWRCKRLWVVESE